MGYFVSAEALAHVQQQSHEALFVDRVTRLANVKGLLFLLAQYLDEYRFGHRNFVAVFIRIRAIDRLLRRYGEEACNELLGCIADEIRRIVGPVGASGRFDRNQFLVFSQYTSQEEVRDLGQRLRTGIEAIHSFGQHSCTLFVEMHMAYPQDQSDFYEDIIAALLDRWKKKS
ncbi:MAG: GGDEF domain-containing protein [Mitsuokella jalaludinii]|nr:GGDEF domain-containing protein [Mitsuokella jalaludinii]MDD7745017.1 GGDEF domain-containing protein [Mitsuokella jalaludinii]